MKSQKKLLSRSRTISERHGNIIRQTELENRCSARALLEIPHAIAKHRRIGFPVAVVIRRHGFVSIRAELETVIAIVLASENQPFARRRTKNGDVGFAVARIISRNDHIGRNTELDGINRAGRTALNPPLTRCRSKNGNVGFSIAVKVRSNGFVAVLPEGLNRNSA